MGSHIPRLLYVEDDGDTRELISFMLNSQQDECSVVTASSAGEAIRAMDERPFDLYILDAWLPDMSGYDLCKHIRSHDTETPVLFFSALSRLDDRDRAAEVGATAFLSKPDDLDIFSDTVGAYLKRSALNVN